MQFFKKLNSASKKNRHQFVIWSLITFLAVAILVSIAAWLAITYRETFDYVGNNFAEGRPLAEQQYLLGKDFFNGHVPTFGEIYNSIGQESFAWFYTTTLHPISLIPYILLPIIVPIAIVGIIKFGFVYFKIFPPKQKNKKAKKDRKEKK